VRFIAITLCVASQRVFIVVSVYFVIDSVRKLLDTPSYVPLPVTSDLFKFIINCETMTPLYVWLYSLDWNSALGKLAIYTEQYTTKDLGHLLMPLARCTG
jgi:hypothetical protein